MVKVQKPTPKTFKNAPNKPNKSNGIKKEKPVKESKAIPASNITAKKAKSKLIEKSVQSKEIKEQVKPVDSVKKTTPTLNETPNNKKGGKKNRQKNSQTKEQGKNVETKAPAKKNEAPAVAEQKKKAVVVEDKPQAQVVSKAQKKKAKAENKPQQQQGKKQEATPGAKPQQQLGKNQKKEATDKPQQQLGKKQKKETTTENKPQQKLNKKQKKKAASQKKEKKSVAPTVQFEPIPFDEEQYNKAVNLESIKKIAEALKTIVEKEVSEKKASIFTDYRYLLNVCSYKIPNCPKRIVKLNLKHSLVNTKDDDVVMIVSDLQRGAKIDYEPTIQHYEDLFREAGVTGLKIVPFNQLRQECTSFETKRKFANTYDHFLCDGRIVGHVVGFCGTHFQKARTTFHAVRMDDPKSYKKEIERALKRTSYKQLQKGDLVSIPVGSHVYSVEQLAENIMLVLEQLKKLYPGGLGNIRNMHLKIDIKGTSSMPLYVNLSGPPAETPNVLGMREERMLKLKKEANDVLTQFNLSKTGEFVKLDKGQVERKRQIQEARKALLADPIVADEETEEIPAKKSKKNKKEVEPESEDEAEEENASDEEEVAEDDEEDDDDEGGSDDDEDDDDEEDDDE